ncbi:MAG: hypothetical protein ACC628_22125, partial [Pirellulaceae bacterium]
MHKPLSGGTPRNAVKGLVVGILCLWAFPAQAVTIFEKGNDQPIRGFLVDQNEFSVTIREVLP